MKIKVRNEKKQLDERIAISSKMSSRFIINNVLNPDSDNSIFDKKLIFYDLETMGLLPSPYVHQIAAIEYDLKNTFSKIIQGKKLGTTQVVAPRPSGGCIIKNEFNLKNFNDRPVIIYRGLFYKKFKQEFSSDLFAFDVIKKIMDNVLLKATDEQGNEKVNLNMSRADIGIAIMSSCLFSETSANRFYSILENHLEALEKEGQKLTNTLVAKKQQTTKDLFLKLVSSRSSPKTIASFLSNLFELVVASTSSPYSFFSPGSSKMKSIEKQDKQKFETLSSYYKNQAKLRKMTTSLMKKEFNLTFAENRSFTHYAEFPLAEYYDFVKFSENPGATQEGFKRKRGNKIDVVKRGLPTEKEGLEIFLKYLQKIGNDNYILIGHNIKTFDNNVILTRAKENNIDQNLILDFQDSYVFDTLDLMRLFTQQLIFMNNLCEKGIAEQLSDGKKTSAKRKKTASSILKAKEMHDTLKEKYPSIKAKLDGIMLLYESTKKIEQSHTADDDCKQLANSLIPTVVQMSEMIKDYDEVLSLIDPETFASAKSFSDNPRSMSKLASSAISKIKSDLLFNPDFIINTLIPGFEISLGDLEFTPKDFSGSQEEFKSLKSNKTNLQIAIDSVIKEFFYYLVKVLFDKADRTLTDQEIQQILTLRRAEVAQYFKSWAESEAKTNNIVKQSIDYIQAFKSSSTRSDIRKTTPSQWQKSQNPLETKPQEDDPMNLSESLVKKWKKMIL